MSSKTPVRIAVLLILSWLMAAARADVPATINYQGRVSVEGVNFDSATAGHAGTFRFALVNADGTTTYWSNDGTSVAGSEPVAGVQLAVSKGLYSVQLGDASSPLNMQPITPAVFASADVRLRIWFDDGSHGSQLLTPDQPIASVAYAMTAQRVPDGSITAAQLAPDSVQGAHIAAGAVGNAQLANSGLTITTGTGLSGGGTVALGGTIVLGNTGVTAVEGGGGITVSASTGNITLGSNATDANAPGSLVLRDAIGGFSAGTITGNLAGNAATATLAVNASNFLGPLLGDVTGTQGATVVTEVGGISAANIATGVGMVSAATDLNIPGTLVLRDANGNFSVGTITGNLIGNANSATTAASATDFTGALLGDVTGTQSATVVERIGGIAPASIATPGSVVKRDANGDFSGANITAETFTGSGAGLTGVVGTLPWLTVNGSAQQAISNTGYLATDDALVTVTLPATASVGDIVRVSGAGGGGWVLVPNSGQSMIGFGAGVGIAGSQGTGAGVQYVGNDQWLPMKEAIIGGTEPSGLISITAGNGLAGGGIVPLGGAISLENVGVITLSGGGGVTVSGSTGAITLGSNATELNAPSTLVLRDAGGNFTAGTITANLDGNANSATTAVAAISALSSTNFTGVLLGDVTGTQGATLVTSVGGISAASVAAGAILSNAATEAGDPGTLVRRGAGGNFAGGTITATEFVGGGTGLTGVAGTLPWQPVTGNAQQAIANTGYLATDAALVTVTLPATASVGDIVRVSGAGAGGWLIVPNAGQSITGFGVGLGPAGSSGAGAAVQYIGNDQWMPMREILPEGTVENAQLANSAVTVTAGSGLAGGGIVPLGGTITLENAGVLSLAGGGGITVSAGTGAITLGSNATDANAPGTLVLRDANGGFAAGTITGALLGNATTATSAASAGLAGVAINFLGSLAGDITGTQGATLVNQVGGLPAISIAAATGLVNAATELNTASTLVRRDAEGNFDAGTITGNLIGSATTAVSAATAASALSATDFTGALAGDVTGTQGATLVGKIGGIAPAVTNTPGAVVVRDAGGDFAAGTITAANFIGSGAGLNGVPGTLPWLTIGGTAQQAVVNTGYLADNAAVVTLTLPVSANAGDIIRVSGVGAGGWAIVPNAGQSVVGFSAGLGPVGSQGASGAVQFIGNGTWQPMNESQLAAGAVNAGHIVAGAVGTTQLAAAAVNNSKLANSSITINTGNGLAGGGPLSLGGSLTLTLAANGVQAANIAPGAVGTAQLAPNLTLAGTSTATDFQAKSTGLLSPAHITLDAQHEQGIHSSINYLRSADVDSRTILQMGQNISSTGDIEVGGVGSNFLNFEQDWDTGPGSLRVTRPLSGTVAITGKAVTGTGTKFGSEVRRGDTLQLSGKAFIVDDIATIQAATVTVAAAAPIAATTCVTGWDAMTGTVSVTAGSATVTGSGTAFLTELGRPVSGGDYATRKGPRVTINAESHYVKTVTSNTVLVLENPQVATASNVTIGVGGLLQSEFYVGLNNTRPFIFTGLSNFPSDMSGSFFVPISIDVPPGNSQLPNVSWDVLRVAGNTNADFPKLLVRNSTNATSGFAGTSIRLDAPFGNANANPLGYAIYLNGNNASITNPAANTFGIWDLIGTQAGGVGWRFFIAANGNVGIGNSAPTTKLEVTGIVKATALQGDGSGLTGISTQGIVSGAVTTPKIADASVTENKITDGAVTGIKIADGVVTANKIADGAVTANRIADGAVGNTQLTSGIDASKITIGAFPAIDGSNLTGLNAGNIAAGTLADARLSANISLLNAASNTFTGNLVLPTDGLTVGITQLATRSGRIGIGTDAPVNTLHLASDLDARIRIEATLNASAGVITKNSLREYFTGVNALSDAWVVFDNTAGAPRLSVSGAGDITIGGLTLQGIGTGTSEAPDKGIITRRIRSTNPAAGQIVARTNTAVLERDGTANGFLVRYVGNTSRITISATGLTASGDPVGFYQNVILSDGTIPLWNSAQNVAYFRIQFGDTADHQTTVEVSCSAADNVWTGILTSTFNQ